MFLQGKSYVLILPENVLGNFILFLQSHLVTLPTYLAVSSSPGMAFKKNAARATIDSRNLTISA
jgi:hypothetical protein